MCIDVNRYVIYDVFVYNGSNSRQTERSKINCIWRHQFELSLPQTEKKDIRAFAQKEKIRDGRASDNFKTHTICVCKLWGLSEVFVQNVNYLILKA